MHSPRKFGAAISGGIKSAGLGSTLGNVITPLNRYHTHSDIVKRKRRVTKKKLPSVVFTTSTSRGDISSKSSEEHIQYVVNVDVVPTESGDQKKLELNDY